MQSELIHASAVALGGRGVLILGRSGMGKSSLALELMALGAGLVADDQVALEVREGRLYADAPPAIRGRIEARGIGLLMAEPAGPAHLVLAINLDRQEGARLPEPRWMELLDCRLRLLFRPPGGHVAAALMQWLKAGEAQDE